MKLLNLSSLAFIRSYVFSQYPTPTRKFYCLKANGGGLPCHKQGQWF